MSVSGVEMKFEVTNWASANVMPQVSVAGRVAGEVGVGAQVGRDGDAALLVRHLVGGAGEEDTGEVAHALARGRGALHPLGDLEELVHREDVEAALLPAGHDQAVGHPLAELRREEEPALVVQAWGVGTEEHRAHLP
jgi:hypothetical protein